jgi:peptidoglycan/LPS O-acetylase OafA/YrhL
MSDPEAQARLLSEFPEPNDSNIELREYIPSGNSSTDGAGIPEGLLSEKPIHTHHGSSWRRYLTPRIALAWLLSFTLSLLLGLIPSFLRRAPPGASAAPKKLHPTAYLDGLRGTAAFFVFIHHTIIDWYPRLSIGYGTGPNPADIAANQWFWQRFPFRIVYSGRGMVAIFFVISGYVLSYKALRLMRGGNAKAGELMDTLASSTFRRGMRLFLPCAASTFMSLLMTRAGWYVHDPRRINLIPDKMAGSFWIQFWDWWHSLVTMSNPFRNVSGHQPIWGPLYDGHLWTIPIEFRGSLVVFLVCVGVARMAPGWRLATLIGITVYSMQQTYWEIFLFIGGIAFADLHFYRAEAAESAADLPLGSPGRANPGLLTNLALLATALPRRAYAHFSARHSLPTKLLRLVVPFGVALFATHILCFPDEQAHLAPGYGWMHALTPQPMVALGLTQRFWLCLGAVLLIAILECTAYLRRVFESALAQYLGRISFALYACHGMVLYTMGTRFLRTAMREWNAGVEASKGLPVPELAALEGAMSRRYAVRAAWGCALDLVVAIVFADAFMRGVDTPSVRVAGRIKNLVWRKGD